MSSPEAPGEPPLVSVLMPVWNGARYLRPAIESVLAQSLTRFELVVIDDGSRDDSREIAAEYAARDPRVRLFCNERNLGIVASRNRAFREAHAASAFFAIFDADDVCEPDRLQRQVEYLQAHPGCALVGGHTRIIDEHGHELGLRRYPTSDAAIRRVITRYNPFAQPTAMIRRAALAQVGEYDPAFPRCQDYDLWLRIAARFEVGNLDRVTLSYRVSSTQGKTTSLRESLRFTIAIQRKWLFAPGLFHAGNVAYWVAEHGLLALPDAVVLRLFKLLTYKRQGT